EALDAITSVKLTVQRSAGCLFALIVCPFFAFMVFARFSIANVGFSAAVTAGIAGLVGVVLTLTFQGYVLEIQKRRATPIRVRLGFGARRMDSVQKLAEAWPRFASELIRRGITVDSGPLVVA